MSQQFYFGAIITQSGGLPSAGTVQYAIFASALLGRAPHNPDMIAVSICVDAHRSLL